jgi:hypothetical protein
MDGFVSTETTENADLNPGIYLSSESHAFTRLLLHAGSYSNLIMGDYFIDFL